jgi:hypothetical protein
VLTNAYLQEIRERKMTYIKYSPLAYSFNVEIACEFGIPASVIYNHISTSHQKGITISTIMALVDGLIDTPDVDKALKQLSSADLIFLTGNKYYKNMEV